MWLTLLPGHRSKNVSLDPLCVLATMLILNRSPYLGLPVMVGIPDGTRCAAPANARVDCLRLHDQSASDHVDDGICQHQSAAGKLCVERNHGRVGAVKNSRAALSFGKKLCTSPVARAHFRLSEKMVG